MIPNLGHLEAISLKNAGLRINKFQERSFSLKIDEEFFNSNSNKPTEKERKLLAKLNQKNVNEFIAWNLICKKTMWKLFFYPTEQNKLNLDLRCLVSYRGWKSIYDLKFILKAHLVYLNINVCLIGIKYFHWIIRNSSFIKYILLKFSSLYCPKSLAFLIPADVPDRLKVTIDLKHVLYEGNTETYPKTCNLVYRPLHFVEINTDVFLSNICFCNNQVLKRICLRVEENSSLDISRLNRFYLKRIISIYCRVDCTTEFFFSNKRIRSSKMVFELLP